MNKNFIYGIAEVNFKDAVIGYIEKGSWDWGGTKPEKQEVEAEQVPGAPVLTLTTKNGTIKPTFNIIQLNYKNLHQVMGGTLMGESENPTGWTAPSKLFENTGKCVITFVSGQIMTIPNATLTASLGGKLTLSEVSKLECELSVNQGNEGEAPYQIADA